MQLAIYLTKAPKFWNPPAKVPFRRHPVTRELLYGGGVLPIDTPEAVAEANRVLALVFANPKADMSLGPAVKFVADDYGAIPEQPAPVAVVETVPETAPEWREPEKFEIEPFPGCEEPEESPAPAPVEAEVISPVEVPDEEEEGGDPAPESPDEGEPRQKRKYTRRVSA